MKDGKHGNVANISNEGGMVNGFLSGRARQCVSVTRLVEVVALSRHGSACFVR
jgi:hypothetical protein